MKKKDKTIPLLKIEKQKLVEEIEKKIAILMRNPSTEDDLAIKVLINLKQNILKEICQKK